MPAPARLFFPGMICKGTGSVFNEAVMQFTDCDYSRQMLWSNSLVQSDSKQDVEIYLDEKKNKWQLELIS